MQYNPLGDPETAMDALARLDYPGWYERLSLGVKRDEVTYDVLISSGNSLASAGAEGIAVRRLRSRCERLGLSCFVVGLSDVGLHNSTHINYAGTCRVFVPVLSATYMSKYVVPGRGDMWVEIHLGLLTAMKSGVPIVPFVCDNYDIQRGTRDPMGKRLFAARDNVVAATRAEVRNNDPDAFFVQHLLPVLRRAQRA